MRKFSLILAVLLFTVPAWATVTITCQQVGTSNDVLVSYVNTEANKVRAFALDITVNNGVISAVDDSVSSWYTIYPGSIVIVDGEVTDDGTAVADPNDHPDTEPGIGTSGITVEMGALYSPPDDANGPPNSGNLLKFTNTVASGNTTVTITENGSRGGVVLTDPNANPAVVAPGCIIIRECYPICKPDYQRWVDVNKPPCWCYLRQCHGDVDNASEGSTKTGYNYVHYKDLAVLLSAWSILEPAAPPIPSGPGVRWRPDRPTDVNICADIDHGLPEGSTKTGYNRVHYKDLAILLASWSILEPATPPIPSGPGVEPNCLNCP